MLAETPAAVLPRVSHLDVLRCVFILAALTGITVAIYTLIDDRQNGRR